MAYMDLYGFNMGLNRINLICPINVLGHVNLLRHFNMKIDKLKMRHKQTTVSGIDI